MKRCSQCGRAYSDLVNTCSYCGTPLSGGATSGPAQKQQPRQTYTPPVRPNTPPVRPSTPPVQSYTPPVQSYTPPVRPSTPPVQSNTPPVRPIAPQTTPAAVTENVGKGILGAFLFSIGGLIVQIILININIIAALAGIVTYLLAITGYQKFSGIGSGNSKKAVWICIPISLLMIGLGTFMGYGIYAGRIWGIPASEALSVIQADQELMDSVMADFGKTAAFWGVSIVYSLIRSRKKK